MQSISWHELSIVGRSAHAGTTPMELRADASVAASRINLRLRDMARSGQYGAQMRATMGAMVPVPGLVNIIPGRMTVTVDLRNPDDNLMRAAEADIIAFYDQVAHEEGVQITWRQTARTDCVRFDPRTVSYTHLSDSKMADGVRTLGSVSTRFASSILWASLDSSDTLRSSCSSCSRMGAHSSITCLLYTSRCV